LSFSLTVTASEPFDRSGPVPAAVRAAGYVSEEEESEEEDGSSVEEEESEEESEYEEEEEDHRHHAHHAQHHHQHHSTAAAPYHAEQQGSSSNNNNVSSDAPRLAPVVSTSGQQEAPPYSQPAEGSGIQLAENGYAAEKKGPAAPVGGGEGAASSGANREVSNSSLLLIHFE